MALMIKFQQMPNYFTTYNWLENVSLIIESTPSWLDRLMIINDEWLLEIGYMNYDYGVGLSQWSLFVVPSKVLGVLTLNAMLVTLYLLMRASKPCDRNHYIHATGLAGGLGASLIALASITMSWVVCCSTPTWVVGLAMMGLGVSTSLWLEPLGLWMQSMGFILLFVAMYFAANRQSASIG